MKQFRLILVTVVFLNGCAAKLNQQRFKLILVSIVFLLISCTTFPEINSDVKFLKVNFSILDKEGGKYEAEVISSVNTGRMWILWTIIVDEDDDTYAKFNEILRIDDSKNNRTIFPFSGNEEPFFIKQMDKQKFSKVKDYVVYLFEKTNNIEMQEIRVVSRTTRKAAFWQ